MKKLFFVGFLTVFFVPSLRISAQNITVTYTYDSAGNRTSRGIVTIRSSSSTEEASSPEILSDLFLKQEIKFYPNPTKGILTVELPGFSESSKGEIGIIDASGRTVKHLTNISGKNTFDLSAQANGIYLLRITLNDETSTWKIIKQ